MSPNEKEPSVSVATVTRPSPIRQYSDRNDVLSTIEDVDSTLSLSPATTIDKERDASPFSPFYSPAPTRTSLDMMKTESKSGFNVYQTDLESGLQDSRTNVLDRACTARSKSDKPCTVWPGRQQLKQQKQEMKRGRGCHPFAKFDKKTANMMKCIIGLLLVGLMIGVGLGVTKAVGGGIWKDSHNPSS